MRVWSGSSALVLSAFLVACGGDGSGSSVAPGTGGGGGAATGGGGPGGKPGSGGNGGGAGAEPYTPPGDAQSFAELKAKADAAMALTAEGAGAAYPTAFKPIDYDPLTAKYLDKIQASALALTDAEKAALGKNGFVISTRREFPTFVRGFAEIYSEHLPVYVSVDAVLETVHQGYDNMLLQMERAAVIPDLRTLLMGMRTRLAVSDALAATRADVDLYLAVALSLLDGTGAAPVAGAAQGDIQKFVNDVNAATGMANSNVFGVDRKEDFSQFKPRGHYNENAELQQYFRSMMWLGRVDLRLIETDENGQKHFRRPQFDAMLLIRDLLDADLAVWQRIDQILATFVGTSDNMVVPEVEKLVADLGGAAAARAASDEAIEKAIVDGGYGAQRIASYLMVNDTDAPLPLNRSFLVLGQRYIVDSEVLSSVVYDRLPGRRMMPDPLDAAFGALGNNQALALTPDVSKFAELPGALARVRVIVDSNPTAFWESSFYNLWIASLRALSPAKDAASMPAGLPQIANTEAWGRRVLNTQLGSWAELRHDTLLYAKQSYSGIPSCDYPDAYVDPYPAAFGAIRKFAENGARIAALAPADPPGYYFAASITRYFENLRNAASILEQIAAQELKGEALTTEQLAFINDAVRIEERDITCTTIDVPNGWLAKLYFDPMRSIDFDPTIADVHTQPADESGTTVGKVLHVGTGYPRYMVATIDSCGTEPRAYAGVVFAYHEEVTKNFNRLTDEEWSTRFSDRGERPKNVPWMAPVLAE